MDIVTHQSRKNLKRIIESLIRSQNLLHQKYQQPMGVAAYVSDEANKSNAQS